MPTLASQKIQPEKQTTAPAKLGKKLQAQKELFDGLVTRFKTPDFIVSDPLSQPYRFIDDPTTCELTAFITSLLSYGRRDIIIPTVSGLWTRMGNDPKSFLENYNPKKDAKVFADFVYRFNKGKDIAFLMQRLQWAYQEFESLENLFIEASQVDKAVTLQDKISAFLDALSGLPAKEAELPTYGLKFLFAHPINGGPCKRFNMFLRWVVRQDEAHEPQVDLGLWKKALSPRELVIPLDTHVNKMNKHFGFSKRLTDTWETAEDITAVFRRFHPEDPIRYDYALMGYSLSNEWRQAQ